MYLGTLYHHILEWIELVRGLHTLRDWNRWIEGGSSMLHNGFPLVLEPMGLYQRLSGDWIRLLGNYDIHFVNQDFSQVSFAKSYFRVKSSHQRLTNHTLLYPKPTALWPKPNARILSRQESFRQIQRPQSKAHPHAGRSEINCGTANKFGHHKQQSICIEFS